VSTSTMDLPPRVRAVISSIRIWPGGIAFAAISGKSHLEAGAGHHEPDGTHSHFLPRRS
jgi:CBS domain-containing protein